MKKRKELLMVVLAAVMMFGGIFMLDVTAKADAVVNAVSMSLDDTFASGTIWEKGTADFYVVTLPSDGWLTVTYQGWSIGDAYYSISKEDLTKSYTKDEISTSTDTSPVTHYRTLALEAGKYVVKVGANGNHTGNYKIKASFKAAGNDEDSNNNEFVTAQRLEQQQIITGFISEDDKVDFYKIELPAQQTIQVIYTARIADSYFHVWNEDNVECHKAVVYAASETQPQTYIYEATLNPGIYYIQIYPSGSNRGRYTLQWKEKVMTKSLSISGNKSGRVIVGKKVKLSAKINPSNTSVKTVEWETSDHNTAEVDQNGNVTTKRPGVVKITATATDGSKKSDTYTLVIIPKKESNLKLSARYYNRDKIYVSFNEQFGSTGYQVQYATNKNFHGAKSKKTKLSFLELTNLKKNNTYYIRVRAYVKKGKKTYNGAWSRVSSVKLK